MPIVQIRRLVAPMRATVTMSLLDLSFLRKVLNDARLQACVVTRGIWHNVRLGMKGRNFLWSAVLLSLPSIFVTSLAQAEPTTVTVRVLSEGAKFIGTSMGGMRVTLKDAETGEVLARGLTAGGTGDTKRIMEGKLNDAISDSSSAHYTVTLDLDRPRLVEAEVFGPLAQAQSALRAVSTMWVVPGKHVAAADGWVLNLRGLVVDVLGPPAHIKLPQTTQQVKVEANVVMMCGCPINPDGPWRVDDFEVTATVLRNGKPHGSAPMAYAGATSQFTGTLSVTEPGVYEVIVAAYQKSTANTGVDRTTFIIEEAKT